MKYFFCKRAKKELVTEFTAQFEKFFATGLPCSHVDSHCHMHVNPAVISVILKLGRKYDVKRIRVPEDDLFSAAPFVKSFLATCGYALVFKLLAGKMKRELRRHKFRFPGRVYGNFLSGAMSTEYVLSVLDGVPDGVSEIYFHPALLSADSQGDYKAIQLIRELHILLDSDLRSRIRRNNIVPVTYFDLDRIS